MIYNQHIQLAMEQQQQGAEPWSLFPEQESCLCNALKNPPGADLPPSVVDQSYENGLQRANVNSQRCVFAHLPVFQYKRDQEQQIFRLAEDVRGYLKACVQHARITAGTAWGINRPIDLLEICGPGLQQLDQRDLSVLASQLLKQYIYSSDTMVRMTVLPNGIDKTIANRLHDAGVNNLMLHHMGGKSFLDRESLKTLCVAVEESFEAGIQRTGVVMRYDHQDCDAQTLIQMLAMLNRMPVREIGLYNLGHQSDEKGVAHQYHQRVRADQYLLSHGWQRLSGWRYRRADEMPLLTEHAKEADQDILGIGAGSSGRLGRLIYQTDASVEDYTTQMNTGAWPAMEMKSLPENYLQLTDALCLIKNPSIEADEWPLHPRLLEQLVGLDLVEHADGRLRLTASGCYWSGNIANLIMEEVKSLYPAAEETLD